VLALRFREALTTVLVQRAWLDRITVGLLVLAVVWAGVVVRSYQVSRPARMRTGPRLIAGALVTALAAGVCAPILWVARDAYALRQAISGIFPEDGTAAPWKHRRRVNVLLLGGDGARDRSGVRTDSVTLASIDTRTGGMVLISLPRNLQRFTMPPRLRGWWPDGYTGYPGDEGLLNELYQTAEDHPELEPGYPDGRRGPRLVSEAVSTILGQPVDYYVLINLFGFADLVNAVGGVKVNVTKPLPIGGDDRGHPPTGWLRPGYRTLNGSDALWYARSRHADNDYARMGRQKCLIKAISDQTDPRIALSRARRIAAAVRRTISTNIPDDLLPAIMRLFARSKHKIRSLMLVPPLIETPYQPDLRRIRQLTADAIATPAKHPGSAGRKSANTLERLCG
jgi:LCP family protein required for cell wall assembly